MLCFTNKTKLGSFAKFCRNAFMLVEKYCLKSCGKTERTHIIKKKIKLKVMVSCLTLHIANITVE